MAVRAKARGNAKPSPFATAAPRLHDRDFVETLETRSKAIRDPVAKLRYIRNSLARYEQADRAVQVVPFSPLRRLLYRVLSAAGLRLRALPRHRAARGCQRRAHAPARGRGAARAAQGHHAGRGLEGRGRRRL